MNTQCRNIPNWIMGREVSAQNGGMIEKWDPHSGALLSLVADSDEQDAGDAVEAARQVFQTWAATPPVQRGEVLYSFARVLRERQEEMAACVAIETGKPHKDALGEVRGAVQLAEFFAGEGMRLYGRSLPSGMPGKRSHTIRQALGVAALIVPANTPIANIAWKVFPALICGNSAVLKASEDAPATALLFAQYSKLAGLADGLLNVLQGSGGTAAAPLVRDSRVSVISFTGSTTVGRQIAEVAGKRLARVSLELGGKNPFVVCDDADIDRALRWASLSAFSNAGQRCAAGSKIIVFSAVYNEFRDKLTSLAMNLKLGVTDDCDLGPLVSERQQARVLAAIELGRQEGGRVLCGGAKPSDEDLADGFYVTPTLLEELPAQSAFAKNEIFGPVASLHRVASLEEALLLANDTEYGLTAAIHTKSVDRATWFADRVRAGVVNVNLGTFGSEPHMPFGGFGASGNGTREPGVEALDVYSEVKNISFVIRDEFI